jgi:hypothetical protein
MNDKKFLDQEGVKYLWSKLSLEDYPNNETLMAVIQAIDTTKLDKSIFEDYTGIPLFEPREEDIPKVFINGIIPTTKDDVNAELTYISQTLTFHSYITIKC